MPEPTPYSLSQFFTALAGKEVNFTAVSGTVQPKAPLMFGLYTVLPEERPLVVRMSLKTLAMLGGSLLGLPDDVALQRAEQMPVDEPMRDAMHEVLNITSTAVAGEGRVIFKVMARELRELPPEAAQIVSTATRKSAYNIKVAGGDPECFNVLQ